MDVRRYSDPHKVAREFAIFLADKIDQSDSYSVALSGGSTPKILFEILADDFKEVINWNHLHVYWGDERCVPPDHSESNYGVANDILFKQLYRPPHIHRVMGESDPGEEAKRYGEEISENLPEVNGLPQFDLIILGMGDDGHTASIFPHEIELLKSDNVCEVATHPTSGQKRVTLTGKVINNAKTVVFLVTGENKADRLREIHFKEEGSEHLPSSHIAPTHGSLIWYMDEAAARYLKDYR